MKILVLLSRFPYPLEKGDKLRAFHQIRMLSRKHEICLFAVSDIPVTPADVDKLKPYCRSIKIVRLSKLSILFNLLGSILMNLPFQVGYFYSPGIQDSIQKMIAKFQPDLVYCQLIRMAEYAMDIPKLPSVLDYMDIFSKGMERRRDKAPFYLKPFFNIEYKRLLRYEQKVFSRFRERTIISAQDRNYIPHPEKGKIHVIPNGIDTGYFQPNEISKKYDLLFSGNMNYPPNIDSAQFLCGKILPLLKKQFPDIQVALAGATPAASVRSLRSRNITVTGWVEDLRSCYASSRIFIAPMTISIGMQNKILEAMAMGIPVITSRLANNAIQAPADCILTADTPQEYAVHATALLINPESGKQMALRARNFVMKNFSWETANDRLEKVLTATK